MKRRVVLPGAAFRSGGNAVLVAFALHDGDGAVAHRWERAWPVQVG